MHSTFHTINLSIVYIAEHLFDSDDDIDMLGQLTYMDENDELYALVIIFNENGSVLFSSDIENTNTWLIYSSMANSSIAAFLINTTDGRGF